MVLKGSNRIESLRGDGKIGRSQHGRVVSHRPAHGFPRSSISQPSFRTGRRAGDSRRLYPWMGVLLVFAGLAIMAYPTISNYFAERNASQVIEHYGQSISKYTHQEIEEARREAVQYNESLAGDPVHDPFVPGSGYAIPKNYSSVLNIDGDGVMGYLDIPKIDVHLPIYHGSDEETLAKGVGHIEQTALPIGETGRHSVLTGHRGLPSAELFTRLDELKVGDEFYLHILNEVLAYRVDDISVIEPDEMSKLSAVSSHDYVTLVTCTPYGVNTHRLLVRGERCEYNPEVDSTANGSSFDLKLIAGASGLLIVAVVACGVVVYRRSGGWRVRAGARVTGRDGARLGHERSRHARRRRR